MAAEKTGDHIGHYKLLEQIGEGGCGVVYVAEQTQPMRRRVALKIIKLGMDTRQVIARFEAERQALALMDHPNIAKVLDAGSTEHGRPFFVMELVKGIPMTRYCDEHKLNTQERLNLFVQVCHAIQHAHQKGIIHRDLKPSNILVADHDGVPVPKVIDFGIAKATTDQRLTDKTLYTAIEQFIGTPAYMSPEQANLSGLDVDTRSDIYSLGVLLYELLTGRTPFDSQELVKGGLAAIRLTIREVEPPRPSTRLSTLRGEALAVTAKQHGSEGLQLVKMMRGDLDWIVMKCLEKDRSRRYETANGLAMDVQRHLRNEPILARPPSTAYRLQKAWRRHKTAFSVTALIAVMLVAATGISVWQTILAKRRMADSEAVSEFLTEMIKSPDPTHQGRTITVAEILGVAATNLETELTNQPLRRVKLQDTLADSFFSLGLYSAAIPLREKVRAFHVATSGPEHPNTLAAMQGLAASYFEAGRRDEALKLREEVLRLRHKVSGPEHPDTLTAMSDLAVSYDNAGRRQEALDLREDALKLRRKVLGLEHIDTVLAMDSLAACRTLGEEFLK
ncbi:MAG: protein kinase domain-containing protein [Limisphaerales bacterium]